MDNPLASLDRRGFVKLGGAALLALTTTGGTALAQQTNDLGYQDITWLIGPADNRPTPSDSFFDNKRNYHYVYWATDTGARSELKDGDAAWSELATHLPGYAVSELPTDLATGNLVFDENRNLPAWWDTDHYEFPNFVDDVLLSPVTVSNTATRTSVFNPDINANSLVQGRIYQLDLHGTFETANTSDQFTVDIDLAGTDVAGVQNAQANADPGTPWTLELTFTVRSHGESGTLKANTRATFNEQPRTATHAPITVDTTTATQLEVYVTWGAADASNVVNVEQAHLKQMG